MESAIAQIYQNLVFPFNEDLYGVLLHNTEMLKTYGLFEFVKAVLDEGNVNPWFLAEIIASYNPKKYVAEISGRTIKISKEALAIALNLPDVHVHVDGDYIPSVDLNDANYACFLNKFVLTFMYLNHPGTKVAKRVHKMRECIMNGHPKHFDFAGFMWLLVENELKQGSDITNCYYARHLQCLIKSQHNDLFVDAQTDDVHNDLFVDVVVKATPTAPKKSQGYLEYEAPEPSSAKMMVDSPKNKQPLSKRKPRKKTRNPSVINFPLEERFEARLVRPWTEVLLRANPINLDLMPNPQFWDLYDSGDLKVSRLLFSPDEVIKEDFWRDLLCLNHDSDKIGWLSDQHISIWVDYLNETRPSDADWCIVDSWFLPLLMRGGLSNSYGDGSRFKVSWEEVRRVFIPMHNAEKHWNLGQFDIHTGVITIYDSFHGVLDKNEEKIWVDDMRKKVIAELPLYVEKLGVFEKKGIDSRSYNIRFQIHPQSLTPQQRSLYGDCGVFLCMFLYRLSHNLSLDVEDSTQAALAYREGIANLVLEYRVPVEQK